MQALNGKVAIVTGGATLIGAGVIEVLRAAGAKVALFDIDAAGGERVAAAGAPGSTRFWNVDISDDVQLADGVASAATAFGRIDFLVNLACTYLDNGA